MLPRRAISSRPPSTHDDLIAACGKHIVHVQPPLSPFKGKRSTPSHCERRRVLRGRLEPDQHLGAGLRFEVHEIEQAVARLGCGRERQTRPDRCDAHDLGEQESDPDLLPVHREFPALRFRRGQHVTEKLARNSSTLRPLHTLLIDRRRRFAHRPDGPRRRPGRSSTTPGRSRSTRAVRFSMTAVRARSAGPRRRRSMPSS
jgi:hypothetical protein